MDERGFEENHHRIRLRDRQVSRNNGPWRNRAAAVAGRSLEADPLAAGSALFSFYAMPHEVCRLDMPGRGPRCRRMCLHDGI